MFSRTCIIVCLLVAAAASFATAQNQRPFIEQLYDFGNVGIDFNLFHNYAYINRTGEPVTITDIEVSCDCSTVIPSDTLVQPGDTAFFQLTFNTAEYYGLTNKSFKVFTTDPTAPEIQYFVRAVVGQWFDGMKPSAISLFFIPGKDAQSVRVTNKKFDEIRISSVETFDSTFAVEVIENKAKQEKALEFRVSPTPDLTRGTYLSSLTVTIEKADAEQPTILSIPVKIVRY
ncbi:MAG: DUF1573 domain-containing protein [Candidatus Zixiibacteriota bacterium]|nr:MAG: DUF1573 domain-containing protein [candidate division Zixibacteria bacterium]